MKKTYLLIFIPLFLLFIISSSVYAASICDESNGGTNGIVPCGVAPIQYNTDGSLATGCPCQIGHIFILLTNIYNFIVKYIAVPLATIALIIGAIFMMVSAGNPNLFGTGKKILYVAIIGMALVFCSWIIINFILCTALGYCNWNTF